MLREGNVFSRVCQSTEGGWSPCDHYPWSMVPYCTGLPRSCPCSPSRHRDLTWPWPPARWILYSRGRVWVHHLSLSSGHRRNGIRRWPSSLIPWFSSATSEVFIRRWPATSEWTLRRWPRELWVDWFNALTEPGDRTTRPPDLNSSSGGELKLYLGSKRNTLLVTSGGHHWRSVQTCSLDLTVQGPSCHQYWPLVATEACMVGKCVVCILLECFLVLK